MRSLWFYVTFSKFQYCFGTVFTVPSGSDLSFSTSNPTRYVKTQYSLQGPVPLLWFLSSLPAMPPHPTPPPQSPLFHLLKHHSYSKAWLFNHTYSHCPFHFHSWLFISWFPPKWVEAPKKRKIKQKIPCTIDQWLTVCSYSIHSTKNLQCWLLTKINTGNGGVCQN